MNTPPIRLNKLTARLALSIGLALALPAHAAVITKADNNSALNLGASWVGGTAPGTGDTALWNNTVQVNTNNDPLGAALSWAGIQVANPGGPVVIPVDSVTLTNTLTLGASGINMLNASQSLTLSNNVALGAPQRWQVGNGQTLFAAGGITRAAGTAILFSFDANPASAVYLQTNATASSVVTALDTGSLLLDGTIGNGTGSGTVIGTVNDVDFAGLGANNQIVPAATLSGLYTANPSGATPTIGSLSGVYDFTNTNSVGARIASTYYIDAMRFNTPQLINSSASTYTYNGVGSWEILFKTGSVGDVNTLLVTTNVGSSYVVVTAGGSMRIADTLNEFTIYQNNPAANLIFQSPITQRAANAIVSKLGGGTLEYQAACSYTGGTLIYGGTVLVDGIGTASTGPVTVFNGGNFEGLNATAANFAPVIVNPGGAASVLVAAANGQFVYDTNLTFSALGGGQLQFVYSNSIVPSTTTAPLLVGGSGILNASNTVNINVLCSSLSAGQFPLVKYVTLKTNVANPVFPFVLAGIQPHIGAYISNNVANSSIDLVITNATAQPLHWAAGSGIWDVGVTANWQDNNGNATTYQQFLSLADNVAFNDLAAGPSPEVVTLNTNVAPGAVTVNDSALNYTITGLGSITGLTPFTKAGTGTLILATTNTFSGGLNLNGGILNFSTLGNLGSGVINFGGGTLQYNGNTDDLSTRTVNFNAGGGTINSAGQTLNFAAAVGNSGAGGLTKAGAGSLTLNTTNKYFGPTFVNQGTLALGATTYLPNSAAIMVASGATFDTATSGVGLTLSSTASQILGGSGSVLGEISAPAATTITPGTNGVFGTLSLANDLVVNGGSLAIDVSTTNTDLLAVAGNLTLTSGFLKINAIGTLTNGVYRLITYGGSLLSGSGSSANLTLSGFSSAVQVATLSDAKAGEIDLVVASGAHDSLVWSGAGTTWDLAGSLNWYLSGSATPWAFTNNDTVRLDDSSGSGSVSFAGTVLPLSVVVSNNAVTYDFEDGSGVGAGRLGGATGLVKDGPGTLVNDTASSYTGPTTIKNGVLQIGNGGIGDIGTGSITNNASLVFNQGDANTHTVSAPISGAGTVTFEGNSPVNLTGNNSYTGPTTINNTVVQIGAGGASGTLGTGAVTNNGTLLFNRTGTLTITNNLTGTGPVAFLGSATVTLGGTNTDANNTYISNGIVKLASATALYADGSAGDWLILDGNASGPAGALDLNGHNLAVNAISGLNASATGLIDNNGGTGTNTLAIVGSATTTFAGTIEDNSGTGGKISLLVAGGAIQTFNVGTTAGNNFSGGTIISNATVYLSDSDDGGLVTPVGLGTGLVTLLNGTLHGFNYGGDNGVYVTGLANNIYVPTNYTGTFYGPYRGVFSGNVTGNGTFMYVNDYVRGQINGNWSGFTGQLIFAETASGGNMGIGITNGFGHVFCTNSSQTIGVSLYCTVAGTPTIPFGELADDGSTIIEAAGAGNAGGLPAIYAVGGLNTSTNFGGSIVDNVGIEKVGTGSWTLTGGNLTYSNLTTVLGGSLVLGPSSSLPNTQVITVTAPGILDVSAPGSITLGTGLAQTLQGNGTVNGSIQVQSAGTVAPGGTNAIGTLTITNDLNLNGVGTVVMELNRTNAAGNSDKIVATTIEAGGTLIVTNIGGDLHTGDTFQLFSAPVTGTFANIILPATTAGGAITYVWTTNLYVNGSVTVAVGAPNTIIPSVPPAITGFSLSGNNVVISGTNAQAGGTYYLLSTTNLTLPLASWTAVATNVIGTANAFTFTGTNVVKSGAAQSFFKLSSTNN